MTRHFDGPGYDPDLDQVRLQGQLERVRALMRDGEWRTLDEIVEAVGQVSATGASARLRDLRKVRFGGHVIERRRVPNGNGLHEYRMASSPALGEPGYLASLPTKDDDQKLEPRRRKVVPIAPHVQVDQVAEPEPQGKLF